MAKSSRDTVLATKTDGTLWSWGNNSQGQLGQNNNTNRSSPVQIPGTTWDTAKFNGGSRYSGAAIKTDGTLWSWGQNDKGNLGQNSQTYYSSPVQIPGTDWYDIKSWNYYCTAGLKRT